MMDPETGGENGKPQARTKAAGGKRERQRKGDEEYVESVAGDLSDGCSSDYSGGGSSSSEDDGPARPRKKARRAPPAKAAKPKPKPKAKDKAAADESAPAAGPRATSTVAPQPVPSYQQQQHVPPPHAAPSLVPQQTSYDSIASLRALTSKALEEFERTRELVGSAAVVKKMQDEAAAREQYIAMLERQLADTMAARAGNGVGAQHGSQQQQQGQTAAAEVERVRQESAAAVKTNEFLKSEVKALHAKIRQLEKKAESAEEVQNLEYQVHVFETLTATRVTVLKVEGGDRESAAGASDSEAAEGEAGYACHVKCRTMNKRNGRLMDYELVVRPDEVDYSLSRMDVEEGVDVPSYMTDAISFNADDASVFFKNVMTLMQRPNASATAGAPVTGGAGTGAASEAGDATPHSALTSTA